MPSASSLVNSAKCWYFHAKLCRDEQCFLDLLVALIHSLKEISITFTNFPHSLIGIFSVVATSLWQNDDPNVEIAIVKGLLVTITMNINDFHCKTL
jgi:hypothetical protein